MAAHLDKEDKCPQQVRKGEASETQTDPEEGCQGCYASQVRLHPDEKAQDMTIAIP